MTQTDIDLPQVQSGTLADKQKTADLRTSEMVALWTIRAWIYQNVVCDNAVDLTGVWTTRDCSKATQSFNAGLIHAGCPEASDAFATFLGIICAAGSTQVKIHAANCANISDDEKRLLHTLAALQLGHTLEAFDILTHLLPGAAVRIALSHAESAAMGLARAGLFLPDRTWKLKELSLTHRLRAPSAGAACVRYMIH
ncbi:MAG: hypothetical protein RJS98_12930 [Rhodospirillaceae bacterium]